MYNKILTLVLLCFACYAQAAALCKDGGGVGVATYASATTADNESFVYVVGAMTLFGGGGKPNNLSVNIAGKKLGGVGVGITNTGFIAKMNPTTKQTVFLKAIELTGDQPSATIDTVTFGNNKIYIAGSISGHGNAYGCNVHGDIYNGGVFIAELDLNGNCVKAISLKANTFVPILLADSASGHLYLYGNGVYGNVTFGSTTFTAPGEGDSIFIAQLSWTEHFEWILRITNKDATGAYKYTTSLNDFAQDNSHVYAYVQASGSLEFCSMDHVCTSRTLSANNNVLIKINKETGSHSVVVLERNVPEYLEASSIMARSLSTGESELYIGGGDTVATVTKYNQTGGKVWTANIPNNCCEGYRNVESFASRLRYDNTGNIYVGGTTLTGSGARFSVSQPFIAKVQRTTGKVLFNTRASRDVTNPPDPYSGANDLAVDAKLGTVYLVGDFGCTLEFGTTKLTTPADNCGQINSPSGRNTFMFIVSASAGTGVGC